MANEIPAFFDSVSNYDYPFIIKEIANGFEGEIKCLRKNINSTKHFLFQYKKKLEKLIKMVIKLL